MAADGDGGANNGAPAVDDRVETLREEMSKYKVQAYIIPTEDPHMVCPNNPDLLCGLLVFKTYKTACLRMLACMQ